MRVGVIAGGVIATAIFGLSIAPTAHADDIIVTLEADALSLLPLSVQDATLSVLGDAIPSTLSSNLQDTFSDFANVNDEAFLALASNVEFAPEISDAFAGLGDVEGAISDVTSVASVGLSIGELSFAAAAASAV